MSDLSNISLSSEGASGNKVRTTAAERKLASDIVLAVLAALGAAPEGAPEPDAELLQEVQDLAETGEYSTAAGLARALWKQHTNESKFEFEHSQDENGEFIAVHPLDADNFPKPREASAVQNIFRRACDELRVNIGLRDQMFKKYGTGKGAKKRKIV